MARPVVHAEDLHRWCRRWLDAEPTQVLFESGNLSSVIGLRLTDGREVVVKVRPPTRRIQACVEVQRHLWVAGFPCPRPLARPAPLGALIATAEAYVPGGMQLEPGPEAARPFAEALVELVRLAPPVAALPTLDPSPAWVRWDHHEPGTWPRPASTEANLNALPEPAWLEAVARRARQRIRQSRRPPVVGHADWESQNIRWLAGRLHVVHDWDSVAAQPEAVIAGAAAAVFPASGPAAVATTLEEAEAFLACYERARGRPWSDDERQVCWAAGLWVLAYNAKLETLRGDRGPVLDRLAGRNGAGARLRLAAA